MSGTFIENAVAARFTDLHESFDDAVGAWHDDDEHKVTLHNFLGLTWDEYRRIVEDPKQLEVVVEERKAKR